MSAEEFWDVETDLQCLFAADEDLQADLAVLCDLLTNTQEESAATSPQQPSRKRKGAPAKEGRASYDFRQRQKISELQQEVQTLKDKLDNAKKNAPVRTTGWEQLAREQRHEARQVLQEHEELREAVDSTNSFISKLTSLLRKKPRLLQDASSEDWRMYKLVAHESMRYAAIHAIADRQYIRKNATFINAGLFGLEENVFRMGPLASPTSLDVQFEFVNRVKLPAPFHVVSQAVWQVFNGEKTPPASALAHVVLEKLDDFTVYKRFQETRDGVTSHANIVRKYFVDDHEHVIVWRSMLEDALTPQMINGAVEDESGWIVLECIDESHCWFTMVLHPRIQASAIRSTTPEVIHAITSSIQQIHIGDSCSRSDHDEAAAVAAAKKKKGCKPDLMRGFDPFQDRGMQFKRTLETTVNAAVHAFQTQSSLQ
ncbi:hypothetical protein AeMF1_002103 [Aphanomyces euteiches]|nr:hypothetical protein AeMF1_002103 [Aphanomyces euteiches]KAH9191515.1 hypothetical protein AeNC1_006509 [Aphanomyces euteiches]